MARKQVSKESNFEVKMKEPNPGNQKVMNREESSTDVTSPIANKDQQQLIKETAYFLAEKRGFEPGFEMDDWLNAEKIIRSQVAG